MSIGFSEILLILACVVLLFGPRQIPELAKACGQAINEFKRAKDSVHKEVSGLLDAGRKAPENEGRDENVRL